MTTFVILDGNAYLAFLAITACLAVMLIIITRILKRIERYTQLNGIDIDNLKDHVTMRTGNMFNALTDQISGLVNQNYNARKRDEKILRRITKQADFIQTTEAMIIGIKTTAQSMVDLLKKADVKSDKLKESGEGIFVALNKQVDGLAEMMRQHDTQILAAVTANMTEVKKGNKDQQEIKTKLTNLRQLAQIETKQIKKTLKKGKK